MLLHDIPPEKLASKIYTGIIQGDYFWVEADKICKECKLLLTRTGGCGIFGHHGCKGAIDMWVCECPTCTIPLHDSVTDRTFNSASIAHYFLDDDGVAEENEWYCQDCREGIHPRFMP